MAVPSLTELRKQQEMFNREMQKQELAKYGNSYSLNSQWNSYDEEKWRQDRLKEQREENNRIAQAYMNACGADSFYTKPDKAIQSQRRGQLLLMLGGA